MNEDIKKLVEFAINSKNTVNKKVEICVVDALEAKIIELKTGFKLIGYKLF